MDCTTALTGLNEWTGNLTRLRTDLPRRLNPPLAAIDRELPQDAKILLVAQAAVFHTNHEVLYNTVFNPEIIELMAAGKSPAAFRQVLHDRGITHIYVDWKEIERHRDPAGYGFTDFVTRERFADWVADRRARPSLACRSRARTLRSALKPIRTRRTRHQARERSSRVQPRIAKRGFSWCSVTRRILYKRFNIAIQHV